MAGGYGRDIGVTVDLQARTIGLALQAWARWLDARSEVAAPDLSDSLRMLS